MSARDDYPPIDTAPLYAMEADRLRAMWDEIDRLRKDLATAQHNLNTMVVQWEKLARA